MINQSLIVHQVDTLTVVSGTDTLTVSVGSNVSIGDPAICISVIDESSPAASTISDDWNSFRSNYPQRPLVVVTANRVFC